MAQTPQSTTDKPKISVFVSYSRKDNLSFVDQLTKGLETFGGMSVLLDRNSIAGGEVWTARTQHLIETCDTILLAVSPEAVKSEICNWEIDLALQTKKRVFTVFNHDMPDADVPDRIRAVNRVFFYENRSVPGSGFATGLAELVELLRTDVDWVRRHSEVAAAAKRWDDNGRRPDDLYKGSQLEEALKWRDARPAANAPELSDLQTAFLNESDARQRFADNVERRRNRQILAGVLAAAIVVIALGVLAVLQARRNAENLGILFAELSQQAFNESDYAGAMRWALAGLDTGGGEVFGPDIEFAEHRLTEANYYQPLRASSEWGVSARILALPDGDVALVTDDGEVGILDGETLKERTRFRIDNPGPDEYLEVYDARISNDGKTILVASNNSKNAVRAFDIMSGSPRFVLPIEQDVVPCARFSEDGKLVLTAHKGSGAKLWRSDTGALVRAFDRHFEGSVISEGSRYNCAAMSRDGKMVATAGDDGNAKVWSAETGDLLWTAAAGSPVNDLAFSPDGSALALATNAGFAMIWDSVSGELGRFNHGAPVASVVYSSDGRFILTRANDKAARIWSVVALAQRDRSSDSVRMEATVSDGPRMVFRAGSSLSGVAMSKDGKRVYSLDDSGRVSRWDAATWDAVRRVPVRAAAISADGLTLAIARSNRIDLADGKTGSTIRQIDPELQDDLERIVMSPDGRMLMAVSRAGAARVFDAISTSRLKSMDSLGEPVLNASFSDDSNNVVVQTRAKAFVFPARGGQAKCVVAPGGEIAAAGLSASGENLAIAFAAANNEAGGIETWSVSNCKRLKRLTGIGVSLPMSSLPDAVMAFYAGIHQIASLRFSSDGRKLLVRDKSLGFEVRDASDGSVLLQGRNTDGTLNDAQWSPNGDAIVAAYEGRALIVWDVATGARRIRIPQDGEPILSQFTSDGLGLVTVLYDDGTSYFDISKLFGGTRKARIAAGCRHLTELRQSAFTATDLQRPVLQSRGSTGNDPCKRAGLLSRDYWFGREDAAPAPVKP